MSAPSQPNLVSEYQQTLLVAAERFFGGSGVPKNLRRAFLDTPRHLFAQRFYSSKKRRWVDLASEGLDEHLAELYSDHPLCLYRDENGKSLSTVSQPSLVLYMLDLLELQIGQRVFELGGGSGWNAALIGRLVGPNGQVLSLEIIADLVPPAQGALSQLGLNQVTFAAGDANLATEQGPFDRGVFTASAWELPLCFFEQIKARGLLLFVLKALPDYDLLCLLRKTSEHRFESELNLSCSFVPVTGASLQPNLQPILASEIPLAQRRDAGSWEGIALPGNLIPDFLAFAKLVFDCQQSYLVEDAGLDFHEEFWAIGSPGAESLLLFNEDRLLLFGEDEALIRLRRAAKRWQKAQHPSPEDLSLAIYRSGHAPEPSNDQWLVCRGDCQLLWSL